MGHGGAGRSQKRSMERVSAGGAAGDVEEHEAFWGGAAFVAFGDVVGDGECGAAELIEQVTGHAEGTVFGQHVDAGGEVDGGFPHGEIFETLIGHGGAPDFKFKF